MVAPTAPVRTRVRVTLPSLTVCTKPVPLTSVVRAEFGTVTTFLTVARVIVAVAVEPLASDAVGARDPHDDRVAHRRRRAGRGQQADRANGGRHRGRRAVGRDRGGLPDLDLRQRGEGYVDRHVDRSGPHDRDALGAAGAARHEAQGRDGAGDRSGQGRVGQVVLGGGECGLRALHGDLVRGHSLRGEVGVARAARPARRQPTYRSGRTTNRSPNRSPNQSRTEPEPDPSPSTRSSRWTWALGGDGPVAAPSARRLLRRRSPRSAVATR